VIIGLLSSGKAGALFGSHCRRLPSASWLQAVHGRERAKGRGVRFGRPLKLSHHQRREAIERLDAGDAVPDVVWGGPGDSVSAPS
jgi:hypothetical protein